MRYSINTVVMFPMSEYIPTTKVQKAGSKNVILFASGSLCPPHVGHISLLECAKKWLETECDVNVIAGYLSPHKDIRLKFNGNEPLTSHQRLELCNGLVSDSTWIMVDSFRCLSDIEIHSNKREYRKGPPSYMSRDAISKLYQECFPDIEFEVWCLLGDDIVLKIHEQELLQGPESDIKSTWGHFFPIICVPRDQNSPLLKVDEASLKVCNSVELIETHKNTPSSSLIRSRLTSGGDIADLMGCKASIVLLQGDMRDSLISCVKTDGDKPSIRRPIPKLIVFDLDHCLWSPEMHELDSFPDVTVTSALANGRGVIGVISNGLQVQLYVEALSILQELYQSNMYRHVKFALASSSLKPEYSWACLNTLEIFPGVPMINLFSYFAIGRSEDCGGLTDDKTTHFAKIHFESRIDYKDMLFFDDCNWKDHVTELQQKLKIVGQKTPHGLTRETYRNGLYKFASTHLSLTKSK